MFSCNALLLLSLTLQLVAGDNLFFATLWNAYEIYVRSYHGLFLSFSPIHPEDFPHHGKPMHRPAKSIWTPVHHPLNTGAKTSRKVEVTITTKEGQNLE